MKLATYERPIERVATAPERAFTIKATGKAFRILSSGLYADKILAIVRELSCNAHDAHVAAGKRDVPFDVHLPSRFEPWFAVRDYGKALSPELIESVFTVYFESTKTDNNDEVGGLGLGCKSPLSYVDSFTVVSCFEGIKRSYTVFFDEQDTPTITEMSAEPTDEPTGLEVKLPVREHDVYAFRQAAEKVYRYFETVPHVTGNSEFRLRAPKVILQGPDYAIVERDESGARALMGVVSYPINATSVKGGEGNAYSVFTDTKLDIRFKIGDLDITAGREELSYVPATQRALAERANEIVFDLTRRVLREMSECANEFEARAYYGRVVSRHGLVKGLFHEGKVPYRGKFISTSTFVFDMMTQFESGGEIILIETQSGRKTPKQISHSKHAGSPNQRSLTITAREDTTFIIDDQNGRYVNFRFNQYFSDKQEHPTFILRRLSDSEIAFLKETFPKATFLLLSEMGKPERATTMRLKPSVLQLGRKVYGRRGSQKFEWNRVDVDMEEGGIFVLTANGLPEYNDRVISEFDTIVDHSRSLGLIGQNEPIYGITKTIEKKQKFSERQDDGWVNFFDLVTTKYREKLAESDWPERIAKLQRFNEFLQTPTAMKRNNVSEKLIRAVARRLSADHQLQKFLQEYDSLRLTPSIKAESDMARMLGVMIPPAEAPDLVGMWQKIRFEERYPMLDFIYEALRYSYREDEAVAAAAEKAMDYIQLCDKNCVSPVT